MHLPVEAQTDDAPILSASVGYDGLCKWETWTPVRVVIENRGSNFDGHIEANLITGTGDPVLSTYATPVSVPSVARKAYRFNIFMTPSLRELRVQLVSETGKTIRNISINISCLSSSTHIYGVIADQPSVYNLLRNAAKPSNENRVAFLDLSDLPDRSLGLSSLEALVFAGVDTNALSSLQFQALENWVAAGGRMIVVGGPAWQGTASGLMDLLPITPEGSTQLSNLSGLATSEENAEGLYADTIISIGSLHDGARTLLEQDGYPLVITQEIGAGVILYLTADPSLEPLRSWEHLDSLFSRLLASGAVSRTQPLGIQDWYRASSAAEMIPNLGVVSIPLLCSSVLLYVIFLGPVNYIVLRKLKRRELAWITIPALVVLFSGLSFVFGSRMRGDQPVLNRLSVVNIIPKVEKARIDSVVGIYSPHRTNFDLEVSEPMLGRGLDNEPWTVIHSEDGLRFPDLHFDVGGLRKIALEGEIDAPLFEQDLTLDITSEFVLKGTITNASLLALQNVMLITPFGGQTIGDINPGETIALNYSSTSYNYTSGTAPDCTLYELLSPSTYTSDINSSRIYSMISAIVEDPYTRGSCSTGIYLASWIEDSPFEIQLKDQPTRAEDLTLYLIELQPTTQTLIQQTTIPSSLFRWEVIEGSTSISNPSAYDVGMGPGEFSLSFLPLYPISYSAVEDLTLYFTIEDSANLQLLSISLWDFEDVSWITHPDIKWGANAIEDPERFVGLGGEIRLRVESQAQDTWIYIRAIELTLIVDP
jgi:hypothetical protein